MEEVLEEPSNDMPAENYLLVGSDSRESVDANDPNAAAIGTAEDAVGRRSDTIMVLRRERNGGASLLSLPRDLWVADRRHEPLGEDQLGLQRGPRTAGRHGHPGPRHPDQPLRRDRLRRVHQARRRDRRRPGLHVRPGPGHPLRAEPPARAARSSTARRPWPTPAPGTTRSASTASGRRTAGPTSAASSVSSSSSAPPSTALLQKVESDPFALGDLIGAATATISIDENLDPVRGRRRPARGGRAGPADVQPAGRRRDRRATRRRSS